MDPRTTRLHSWEGPLPEIGNYLKTRAGSVYLIIGVHPKTKPHFKYVAKLDLLKFTPDEITDIPVDSVFFWFAWG